MPGPDDFSPQSDFADSTTLLAAALNLLLRNTKFNAGQLASQTAVALPSGVTFKAADFQFLDGSALRPAPLYDTGIDASISLTRDGWWSGTITGYMTVSAGYVGKWFAVTAKLTGLGSIVAHVPATMTRQSGSGDAYVDIAADILIKGSNGDVITLELTQETALGGETADVTDLSMILCYEGPAT